MSNDRQNPLDRFKSEVMAEFSRLGTQGRQELASALFNGSGFVLYGPGQYTPSIEHQGHQEHQEHQQERELERE